MKEKISLKKELSQADTPRSKQEVFCDKDRNLPLNASSQADKPRNKQEILCDCDVIHGDVVEKVRKKMPDDGEFNRLSTFFKVFGDSTRAKIIFALDEHEMCVCDLAALLNASKSAVSHQLAYLKQTNLVNYRREGKTVIYSLADEHIKIIFEAGREHINE